MFKQTLSLACVAALASMVSACGGGNSKDAAKAILALQSASGQSQMAYQLQEMKARAEGEMLLHRFRAETHARGGVHSTASSFNCGGGDGDTFDMGDMSCACSNITDGISIDCDMSNEQTFACGADTYTMKGGEMEMTLTIKESGSTLTSGFGLDFSFDMMGGEISDFVTFACKMSFNMTFDRENPSSGPDALEIGCDNFSCSVDGTELSCEDLQTQMSETSCGA